jgi:hypothetical protein
MSIIKIQLSLNPKSMNSNMGTLDNGIRILIAVATSVCYYTGIIRGSFLIILGIIALVFVATSLMSFCPLYEPNGLITKRNNKI